MQHTRIFAILALGGLLAGCGQADSPGAAKIASQPTEPCRIKGLDIEIRCAKVSVFENRETNQGRKIDIHVAILPAKADRKKSDPVFVFAGGPGQGAIEVGPRILPALGRLNRERDLVFVDQRGTGKSNRLACRFDEKESMEGFGSDASTRRFIEDCLADARKHADPKHYHTTPAMQDIDEVRKALGYERINVWGASYGTRAALEFARLFPQHTRSAVLDGMAPFGMALPLSFIPDTHASLDSLIKACATSKECSGSFPDLDKTLTELVTSLNAKPRRVSVQHPRTGEDINVTINGSSVLGGIRSALYIPNLASLVPLAIEAARKDDFRPLASLGMSVGGAVMEEISLGMHLSVICSEDWPLVAKATANGVPTAGLWGESMVKDHRTMCSVWPAANIPESYFAPVNSDVPMLLLSGGTDPATPPRHAEALMKQLKRGKHLVAPNLGHGVSMNGCAPELIKRFVEDGNADQVDGACLGKIPRPTFFTPLKADAANAIEAAKKGAQHD